MKSTVILILVLGYSLLAGAQIVGPNGGNDYISSTANPEETPWQDLSSLSVSDNSYASFGNISGNAGATTDYIIVLDFGLSIPDGATLSGIVVEVERSDPNGLTEDHSVRIVRGGIIGSEEKSTGLDYPLSDVYQSYGSPTDKWGETWESKDITLSDFGVAISARRQSDGGITAGLIDHVRITVYYTFTTLPLQLVSFTATEKDSKVKLDWFTEEESNIQMYTIERSGEGRIFYPLSGKQPLNGPSNQYSVLDEQPSPGTNYYRLKIAEQNGAIKYSRVAKVQVDRYHTIKLSPSPWSPGKDLLIENPSKHSLSIWFYNAAGELTATAKTKSGIIPMPDLKNSRGLHYFRVFRENGGLVGSGSLLVE